MSNISLPTKIFRTTIAVHKELQWSRCHWSGIKTRGHGSRTFPQSGKNSRTSPCQCCENTRKNAPANVNANKLCMYSLVTQHFVLATVSAKVCVHIPARVCEYICHQNNSAEGFRVSHNVIWSMLVVCDVSRFHRNLGCMYDGKMQLLSVLFPWYQGHET